MKKLALIVLFFCGCGRGHEYPKPFEPKLSPPQELIFKRKQLDVISDGNRIQILGDGSAISTVDGATLVKNNSQFVVYKQDQIKTLVGSTGAIISQCSSCSIDLSAQFALIRDDRGNFNSAVVFDSKGEIVFNVIQKSKIDAGITDHFAYYSTDSDSSLFHYTNGEVHVSKSPIKVSFEKHHAYLTDQDASVHAFEE